MPANSNILSIREHNTECITSSNISKKNIVRDDQVTKHVVEHKMLLHTRPPGENIHKWALSFRQNIRRHRHATKKKMSQKKEHMYVKTIFASQLTSAELETIAGLYDAYPRITEGVFSFTNLTILISKNISRFTRAFSGDRRTAHATVHLQSRQTHGNL